MFSKIDNTIIVGTQWMLRQIELSTFLTRSRLLRAFLFLALGLVVARTCVGLRLTSIPQQLGMWIVFGFLVTLPYFLTLYDLSKISQRPNVAPQEIVTRHFNRGMAIFLVSTAFLFYMLWAQLTIRDEEDMLFYFCIKIIFWESVFFLVVEYLLCTISLPPGEKERKKAERESWNGKQSLA